MSPEPQVLARGRVPGVLRALRIVAIVLLVLAAVLTLVGLPELSQEVAAGRWPRAALALPPAFLALFILGYAAYRLVLVRADRYPAGKALVQIGLMVLALGVVAGLVFDHVGSARGRDAVGRGLRSNDPEVRAMAAELVRYRPTEIAVGLAPRLVELLEDADPDVRQQAHASLVTLAGGVDLGASPDAVPRWRQRFPVTR